MARKSNDDKKKGLGRGLGKGLEALFEDSPKMNDGEEVNELTLTEIRPNPYQPRKTFDEKSLKELAESIKENGVFQPIIVRKSVNGYEIIAGERRFRASKLANKTTIPAIIRDFDEAQMMEVAVLENLQREDLTPLEEAQAYETLQKNLGLTQEEVSKRLGKSRPYIANYLRLLTLPQKTKRLLQHGELSMGQARTLLGLKNKDEIDVLAKKVVKEGITVRQLEALVNRINENSLSQPKQKRIGERGRVSLAKLMLSESNFLILDEPTNHLDIMSKEILEDAINGYTGTVLYVSHDRYFINKTASRILELNQKTLTEYLGNYEYYLEKKEERLAKLTDTSISDSSSIQKLSDNKQDWKKKKEEQAAKRKKENELKKCEDRIEALENRNAEIDELMAAPDVCTDVAKLQELSKEKEGNEAELAGLYEKWEGLSE